MLSYSPKLGHTENRVLPETRNFLSDRSNIFGFHPDSTRYTHLTYTSIFNSLHINSLHYETIGSTRILNSKLEISGYLSGPHLDISGTYSDSQRPPERAGVDGIPIGGRSEMGHYSRACSLPRLACQRVPFGKIGAADL